MDQVRHSRRRFLSGSVLAAGGLVAANALPAGATEVKSPGTPNLVGVTGSATSETEMMPLHAFRVVPVGKKEHSLREADGVAVVLAQPAGAWRARPVGFDAFPAGEAFVARGQWSDDGGTFVAESFEPTLTLLSGAVRRAEASTVELDSDEGFTYDALTVVESTRGLSLEEALQPGKAVAANATTNHVDGQHYACLLYSAERPRG